MEIWIYEELLREIDRLDALRNSGLISAAQWHRECQRAEDEAEDKQRQRNAAYAWFE